MNKYILYHLLGICALLLCSFFFSGSETALFSLSPFQIRRLRARHGRRGELVSRLIGNPRRLLISILIGNMFVNIFSSTVAESLTRSLIPGWGTAVAMLVMTFAILVVGEITPKTISIQYPEKVSLFVSPVISAVGNVLSPLRRVVRLVSDRIIALLTRKIGPPEEVITEEELRTVVAIGHREGVVDDREREMIHGVFDFAGKTVSEIMRPRGEIVAFDIESAAGDIEKAIRENEYSRIPVYEGEFDNIIGILYAKDLLRAAQRRPGTPLREILRPPCFVPETKSASSILREFRRRRIHMAIVVDEYGSVSGLVTLEDLIEEIIGEIRDKGDAAPSYRVLGPDSFRIKARMELDEFNELLGSSLSAKGSVTIGGFLINRIGSIPPEGYAYRSGDLVFTIARARKNRIEEIIVRRVHKTPEGAKQ